MRYIANDVLPQRESSAVFDDGSKGKTPEAAKYTLEQSEVNGVAHLVTFECRGCEFIDFEPRVSQAVHRSRAKLISYVSAGQLDV